MTQPPLVGLTVTLRQTTIGRTPLDEGSARRRDLYLTKHNIHKRQTCMSPEGFEPAIPASKQAATDPCLRPRGHLYQLPYAYFIHMPPTLIHLRY